MILLYGLLGTSGLVASNVSLSFENHRQLFTLQTTVCYDHFLIKEMYVGMSILIDESDQLRADYVCGIGVMSEEISLK